MLLSLLRVFARLLLPNQRISKIYNYNTTTAYALQEKRVKKAAKEICGADIAFAEAEGCGNIPRTAEALFKFFNLFLRFTKL